jgi:hypothetical protein
VCDLFDMRAPVVLTRSVHCVSDSANVPRFGLRPNLLLNFAPSDTQRTPLGAVLVNSLFGTRAKAELGSDPNLGFSLQASQQCITDLAKPQVQGSDPNSAACADERLFMFHRGFLAISVR